MAAQTGTTSAPSAAANSWTAARKGLFWKPSSATLAIYRVGLAVSRKRSRSSCSSSRSRPMARTGRPVSSCSRTRSSNSLRNKIFLSPVLACRVARSRAFSTDSRSARASSVLMTSMSPRGSILPATWTTSSFSKQRTTWAMASVSRILARNLLPSPSPRLAPATRPAMSTNCMLVGMMALGLTMAAMASRRGSGRGTTPTLGSMVQKG